MFPALLLAGTFAIVSAVVLVVKDGRFLKLTTFRVPKASYIWDITIGPDGKLYFTDGASRVWSITTSGKFTTFPFKDSTGGYPYQITKGPDGNLWFTEAVGNIGRITTS
jgi:virginiamycin B lyase